MTAYYLPFGEPAIVVVDVDEYQEPGGYWAAEYVCRANKLGDLSRFVVSTSAFETVASPLDDQGVPVYPASSSEGTSRVAAIKLRFPDSSKLAEARNGILADLDEYIRTTILLRDHMVAAETYVLVEGDR